MGQQPRALLPAPGRGLPPACLRHSRGHPLVCVSLACSTKHSLPGLLLLHPLSQLLLPQEPAPDHTRGCPESRTLLSLLCFEGSQPSAWLEPSLPAHSQPNTQPLGDATL